MGGWTHSKSGSFMGGKVTCVPNLDRKSLPNKGTGHSGIYKNSWVTWGLPSDIFRVGLRHKGCIYHHLRPSSCWVYWCIKSIGLAQSFIEIRGWFAFPLNHFGGFCHAHRFSGPLLGLCKIAIRCLSRWPFLSSVLQCRLDLLSGGLVLPTTAGLQ